MRRLLVVALVFGLLGGTSSVAVADQWSSTVEWVNKDVRASTWLRCSDNRPAPGHDACWGRFFFTDEGVDNVNHVEFEHLQMMIDRAPPGGTAVVLRGSPNDNRDYFSIWFDVLTTDAACLHDDDFPQDITENDTVWTRSKFRVHWNDGTATAWRFESTQHIQFTLASQCT